MVLEYVEKNQFKSSGMQSIAFEAISWWVLQPHEYTVGVCTEKIQIETASSKHTEMETLDFELIF
jgi:hypothetical protein